MKKWLNFRPNFRPNFIRAANTRHAAWLVSGTVVQAASAFVTNAVLARFLLPEDFGKFAIVIANISLVKAVVSFPVGTLILRASDDELAQRLDLYTTVNAVQNGVILLGSVFLLLQFDSLSLYSFVLLASVISSYWVNIETALYERNFPYKKLSVLETIAWLAGHGFSLVGVLLGLGPLVLYARDLIRQSVLILGINALQGLQPITLRWISPREWKLVLQDVRGFWANRFLENSFERIMELVVGALAGDKGAGYFFQAQRFALLPYQLLSPVTSRMAMNYFSHRTSEQQGSRLLLKVLGWTLLLFIPFAGGIALFAPPVIPVLLGPGWEPVVPILIAMLGFSVASNPFELLKSYYIAQAKMRALLFLGRVGQYTGFCICAVLVILGVLNPGVGLAFGLSLSYLLPTALLTLQLCIQKKRVYPG